MIFGKTYERKRIEKNAKRALLIGRNKVFVWLPQKTNTGAWVWFQHAYVDYGYYRDDNNGDVKQLGISDVYYINETGNI